MAPVFILASASPARRQLLETVGIQAQVRPSQFDESTIQDTQPENLVQALALGKAHRVAEYCQEPALVLGCDSVLALDNKIYGKPENQEAAIARWQQMRGRTGNLYTGHALIDIVQPKNVQHHTLVRCQVTQVQFAQISDRQIEAYVNTAEPLNCAGCFALDGKGGLFIEGIQGCHSNVIGLSLPLLRQMLTELGHEVTDFW
ncbi:MAG: Maf-like protein [Thermosynechococcaceae cyanobacterium MS004]|nr:Maf-like protein [Thermosynechococcaceae cyanobacterium MS004]